MTTPWGKAGAWADDSERAELEESTTYTAPAARIGTESESFPSLAVAAAAKPKKKKNVAMSLAEFSTGTPTGPGAGIRRGGGDLGFESKRLTQDEMRMLPTGPKERSAEEMESGRLGGGFRSYGGRTQGGPPGRDGQGSRDGAWGGGGGGRRYGGFDDENRSAPPPREDLPSRADEVDNWASGKKTLPSRMDSGGGRDRYGGGLGGGDSGRQDRYSSLGGGSRADEVDNWASGKKPLPARSNSSSSSSFGSGFRDPAATEGDRWTRTGPLPSREVEPSRERTRLVFAPPSGGGDGNSNDVAKTTRASPFGAARPREEILAEKGLDYKQLDSDIDTKNRPTSSHSSRPTSAHSNRPESPASQVLEVAAKPRPRVNPFGDAKPREVLLQEKGKDWRKIDFELEHRGVNRPETEEEQRLKDEIERLKIELGKEAAVEANGEQSGLQEIIISKEKELEKLISDLDDKVRFGQKATGYPERPGSGGGRSTGFTERPGSGGSRSTGFPERPGSGGGRNSGYPDRPPSQSGPDVEYIDRPRSHGTGDSWRGPVDDRRGGGYQGGRDGGYQGGRDGGYQGGRDGRYQGGRDGGYQGGRDGGFSSGREDRQRW